MSLSLVFLLQRNPNSRLTHVLQDFDLDEHHRNRDRDDEDDLCSMMDRLPHTGNKRR